MTHMSSPRHEHACRLGSGRQSCHGANVGETSLVSAVSERNHQRNKEAEHRWKASAELSGAGIILMGEAPQPLEVTTRRIHSFRVHAVPIETNSGKFFLRAMVSCASMKILLMTAGQDCLSTGLHPETEGSTCCSESWCQSSDGTTEARVCSA